jgi:hypothetical protein
VTRGRAHQALFSCRWRATRAELEKGALSQQSFRWPGIDHQASMWFDYLGFVSTQMRSALSPILERAKAREVATT